MIADEDDVANEDAEEDFDVGMRHHAMEYDAFDKDNDGQLDFNEFCKLMTEREVGTPNIEELRKRFDALDTTKDGRVQMHEYLRYALRDALARSSSRVVELLTEWDADNSGSIDRREFRKAVRALGFTANDAEIDILFEDFDEDGSGTIEYRELNKKMRQASGVEVEQRHKLRRKAGGRKGSALSTSVAIDFVAGDTEHTQAQLRKVLSQNAVRIIDLFRDWDEDGNGLIDKQEFVKAMTILTSPRTKSNVAVADYEALFNSFDKDGSGEIDYNEMNKLLRCASLSRTPNPSVVSQRAIGESTDARPQPLGQTVPLSYPRARGVPVPAHVPNAGVAPI